MRRSRLVALNPDETEVVAGGGLLDRGTARGEPCNRRLERRRRLVGPAHLPERYPGHVRSLRPLQRQCFEQLGRRHEAVDRPGEIIAVEARRSEMVQGGGVLDRVAIGWMPGQPGLELGDEILVHSGP